MRILPVLVSLSLIACGGAPAHSETPTQTALAFAPPEGSDWLFARDVREIRGGTTRESAYSGHWQPTSATEATLIVASGDDAVAHDTTATLHYDARGVGLDTPDALAPVFEGHAFDAQVAASALALLPVGTSAVALPLAHVDGGLRGTMSLAPLSELHLPDVLVAPCTLEDVQGHDDWVLLACSGQFTGPRPTEPEWTVTLHVAIETRATIERETGVAREATQHVVVDITQRLGDHEEHEGGEAFVHTVMAPVL